MDPEEVRRTMTFSFEEGMTEELLAARVGPNTYRLEETPFPLRYEPCEAGWHDVIEGETQTDGTIRFVRIIERSGLQSFEAILP